MEIDHDWARRQGGVLSTAALRRWGNSDRDIRRAVASGDAIRVRRGWIALPGAEADVVAAVTAGGSLSCVSALRRMGVWSVDRSLHVRRPEESPFPLPAGAHHCPLPGVRRAPGAAVDGVAQALVAASRCVGPEDFLVLLDSVVNLRLLDTAEVEELFRTAPRSVRRVVSGMRPAESGTETLVRRRLRRLGLPVRSQVVIPGVGRVDLLVGERLVIEVDSVAHHTSLANYRSDRERDRRLVSRGFVVIRLTYEQVMFDWPDAEADIVAVHRRLTRRRSA